MIIGDENPEIAEEIKVPYFAFVFFNWNHQAHSRAVTSVARHLNPFAADVFLSLMEKIAAKRIGSLSGIKISESIASSEVHEQVLNQGDE